MVMQGIDDYLASAEARRNYINEHSGGYLTRAESTFNLAATMATLMNIITMIGQMEGQTPESRELFKKCVDSVRDLHKMLIVNSGVKPEEAEALLKEAGHSVGEGNE